MSNPQIDTRAEIEKALEEFDIFLAAGIVVWSLPPADNSALVTLTTVAEEFENLKTRILAA